MASSGTSAAAVSAFVSLPDLSAVPTRDLILALQSLPEAPRDAQIQTLFTAVYERFGRYLMKVILRKLGPGHPSDVVADILQDTFLQFFANSRSFEVHRAPDNEACELNLRCYLAQMARWKARDRLRTVGLQIVQAADPATIERHRNDTDRQGVPEILQREGSAEDSPEVQRAFAWMGALSERDADILRTYRTDDHPGRKGERLPTEVVARLCQKYGVTPSALLKRKSTLEKLFKAYVEGNA